MTTVASVPVSHPAKQPSSRVLWQRTLIYYAGFICMGMLATSLGPTLPSLAEQTMSSLSAISALFAFRAWGRLIGTPLAGRIYDRISGHPIVALAVLTIVTTVFLTSVIPVLWVMCIVFFFLGFAESFMDVGVNTLLVWTHRERSTPYINGLHLCFGLGAFLIPIISAYLINVTNVNTGVFLTPFESMNLLTPVDNARWVYRFLGLAFLPVALVGLMPSPKSAERDDSSTTEPPVPVSRGVILLFCTLLMLYVGAEVSFSGWIYTYALKTGLTSAQNAAYLVSAFWLMIMLGRVIVMALTAYILPRNVLRIALILSILGASILLVIPQALWLGTIIFGLGMSPIFPTTLAFANQRIGLTAAITSYFYLGAGIGVAIFPWIVGQLIEPVGAVALIWIVLFAMVTGFVILQWLIRKIG